MDPEKLFSLLKNIIDTMPPLHGPSNVERMQWLARASALVERSPNYAEGPQFRFSSDAVSKKNFIADDNEHSVSIKNILFRTFALVELEMPAALQGAYIPAGNAFDALAAVSKVFFGATRSLLIVDPYADDKLFTDFLPTAPETVTLRVLSDAFYVKPSFVPAVARWKAQYTTGRLLDARLAAPRALHDRLIIVDDDTAWIITQSFNALAQRSSASVAKFDAEPGKLKIDAYRDIWTQATQV